MTADVAADAAADDAADSAADAAANAAADAEDIKPKMTLLINFEGRQITVKLRPNTSFEKVFKAAEKSFGKESGTLKFVCDGERILPQDTPAGRDMEDKDCIDAHLEQVGGL